jgi:hypothetical protein
VRFTEPFVPRHPWVTAILLGTIATPAGVVIAWLAPRPLDLVVAFPLVLLDIWVARAGTRGTEETAIGASAFSQLLLLTLGIVLTWLFYVLVARVILWRLVSGPPEGSAPD